MKKNKAINSFQKYLSLWVVLCMAGGILIGKFLPAIPQFLNQFEYANVSIPTLATIVGVLVEVPVMLLLVKIANNTKGWFDKNER